MTPAKENTNIPGAIVYIRWLDSHSYTREGAWCSLSDILQVAKPLTVESVGIVLHESDESITVADHWNHGDPDNDEEITSVLRRYASSR